MVRFSSACGNEATCLIDERCGFMFITIRTHFIFAILHWSVSVKCSNNSVTV